MAYQMGSSGSGASRGAAVSGIGKGLGDIAGVFSMASKKNAKKRDKAVADAKARTPRMAKKGVDLARQVLSGAR